VKLGYLALGLWLAAGLAQAATPYEERLGGGWRPVPVSRSDAVSAYEGGRFATALRLLRPFAEGSDPDAQLKAGRILGGLGELGVGAERVPTDSVAAVMWLGRSAKGGNVAAMRDYGRAAEFGDGMPRDPVLAFRFYAQAAQKLPDGEEKAAALADALRLKPEAARYAAEFPAEDRQAQSLAEALRWTETLASGVTAATRPDLRR
jgi:TPR repeat protein